MNVRRLFAALLLLGLFIMAVRETIDPDMWWHLRTGEFIIDEGIPNQDIFSFTQPYNQWVTHEWLSEVIMWSVYLLGGFPLLILAFAAVITGSYWLVYLRSDGRPYLAGFVVLLAALASAPLWGTRPQMFNIFFTALFIFLIEGFKERKVGKKVLWILPLLTLIWANFHSGYLFGVAIICAYVIGDSLQQLTSSVPKRGLEWSEIRWLLLMGVLSFLAAVINPNGPELWIYPFFTLGSSAMQQYIQEWQSPDFHLAIFWPFLALIILGLVGFIASRRKPALTDVLLFGTTALAGLLSVRHIPLFSIASAVIITRYLLIALEGTAVYPLAGGGSQIYSSSRRTALNWLLLFSAIVVASLWIGRKIGNNETAIARYYPVQAVDFLEKNGFQDKRGFNDYMWGGYLIWRGFPVYVDGRADVYGDEFLFYYLRAFDLTDRWRQPLEDYDVDYVLVNKGHKLGIVLAESQEWEEAYRDERAVILVPVEG